MRKLHGFAATLFATGMIAVCPVAKAAQAAPAPFTPTRFTVVDEGAAGKPDVLLIPGLASSRAVFDAEAKLLAPSFRLHRLQINGFAGQPAGPNATGPILPAVAEEIHLFLTANHLHPVVIGHSLGGLLGLMLADAHPEDVRKLLVIDALPFYALVFNPQATLDNVRPQGQAIHDGMLAMPADQFAAMQGPLVGAMVKNPDGAKLVTASSVASDRAVFANSMLEDLLTDLRPDLPRIKTPTLVLYPYDPALQGPDPAKVVALYHNAYSTMPNVTLQQIDDSRHFIMYDQPAALHAAVQAFLKPAP